MRSGGCRLGWRIRGPYAATKRAITGLTKSIAPTMDAQEVAAAIVHMASLPLSTNILTLTIMATKMPFVGPG